jgi:hypothetical protein
MVRTPHYLGSLLTDGGEVSLTHRSSLLPRFFLLLPDTHFGLRLSEPQGLRLEKLCPYQMSVMFTTNFQSFSLRLCSNKALPYLMRLVAGFPPRRPGFEPGHVRSVVDRAALVLIFSKYLGFPCHFHSTNCYTMLTIIQGCYSRSINGRSNSGLSSTPASIGN